MATPTPVGNSAVLGFASAGLSLLGYTYTIVPMNSSVTAIGDMANSITPYRLLNSVTSGVGTISPTINPLRTLDTAISGSGEITSSSIITRLLNSAISGDSLIAGNAEIYRLLNSAVSGEGILSSDAIAIRTLPVTLSGLGSIAGEFVAIRNLVADLLSNVSNLVADSNPERGLSANLDGISSIPPIEATVFRLLNSALEGTCDLNPGNLIAYRLLDSIVSGQSNLRGGTLVPYRLLDVTLDGIGSFDASEFHYLHRLASSLSADGNVQADAFAARLLNSILSAEGLVSIGQLDTFIKLFPTAMSGSGSAFAETSLLLGLGVVLDGVGVITLSGKSLKVFKLKKLEYKLDSAGKPYHYQLE